jgi:hypothetical protein
MRFWGLVFIVLALVAFTPRAKAQIVTIPIPGTPGLNMTVGTGVNALPLQDIRTNPNAVNITTSDDWYNEVPLGFTFPLFGQNFTTSWAATNGFVTFQNPQTSGLWGGCCSGVDLRSTTDPRYNYTIYGLHTDLYSWNGQNQYYLRDGNSMTYGWYDLSQCCSSQGGNSFEIKINSSGLIDTRISGAMVSWNPVTSGVSGNLANGEYYQYYHGQGLNITPGSSNIFSWQALNGTGPSVDPCTTNPLSSPSCAGYAQAYLDQQCTISSLFSPSCPGYAQAYFNQQCTINSLYNSACPGYAAAYLTQQCTISALYSPSCPGYQQAYFNQQCTANPLYSSACPGYEEAYRAAQFAQACSNNPQISPRCPNYVAPTATTTTSTTTNTASSTVSEPVATAVAPTTTTTSSTTTTPTNTTTTLSTSEPPTTVSVNASGTLTSPTAVAVVADPVVNNVVTNNQTTTAVTATSATAQSTSPATTTTPTTTSSTPASSSSSSSSNNQTQNTRAALVATLTKPGGANSMTGNSSSGSGSEPTKADASAMGAAAMKDSDTAGSMEQQKQVQNVVLGAMAYVPGFDAYNVALKDVAFYKPFTIYGGQKNVDNARAGRRLFGATDQLHNEMVNSQYQLGK